ncbi:MAG TPA: outer membrane beta-barrel protein [Rhodocyclaceae bacterium]|nr:outer membrane beta-barrel protein [Rhodocyclaceae bacterium]
MKKFKQTFTFGIAAGFLLAGASAQAAAPTPYVGAGISQSNFKVRNIGGDIGAHDNSDPATNVYGGLKFNNNFGVEAGYAYLNHLRDDFQTRSGNASQSAHAQAIYAVGTASVPLGGRFEATANAGVAQGHVTKMSLPDGEQLGGDKLGMTGGVGVRYNIAQHYSAGIDYQHFAKLSDHVKANMVGADFRYSF